MKAGAMQTYNDLATLAGLIEEVRPILHHLPEPPETFLE